MAGIEVALALGLGVDSVNIGEYDKKNVSRLNNELFLKARAIMEDSSKRKISCHHIGWHDLSNFIDYLEKNYSIKKC